MFFVVFLFCFVLSTKHYLFAIWSCKTISKTHVFSAADVLEEIETITDSPLSSRNWNWVDIEVFVDGYTGGRHRADSRFSPSLFMEAKMITLIFKIRTTLYLIKQDDIEMVPKIGA